MLRRIVLDVLKPPTPIIADVASELSKLKSVDGVNIQIYNREPRVEFIRITIEGKNLDFKKISKVLEDMGASIQSVDDICMGKKIVRESFCS